MKNQAMNPYLPSYEYVPDGEPYVFDNRIYIFGSHDRFDSDNFCMNDYVCWSAPVDDMGNWKNEGIIYQTMKDPLNVDGTQFGFAPDVQKGPDGRYYFYYALHRSPVISVAVCDTVAGEYQFYGHVHYKDESIYGQKSGDVFNFDPSIFIDEDGKIYLYTGFSPSIGPMRTMLQQSGLLVDGAYCVELEQDMLTIKGGPKLVAPCSAIAKGTGFEEHAFYEASSVRKIRDKYYLVYSSEKSHELCYAVSDKPDCEFHYGGIIISNGDVGMNGVDQAVNYTGNTHGGMVEIQGQWYVFHHRQTNGHHFSRQGCAEPIEILKDGSIPQVEMTSCGLNQVPLSGHGKYEARIACNLSSNTGTYQYDGNKHKESGHPYFTQTGKDREEDGDQFIANMQNGAWAGYKYFSFTNEKEIKIWVRGTADGSIKISTKRGDNLAAVIRIQPSDAWTEYSSPFDISEGKHALYFQYEGAGSMDFTAFEIQ